MVLILAVIYEIGAGRNTLFYLVFVVERSVFARGFFCGAVRARNALALTILDPDQESGLIALAHCDAQRNIAVDS